MICTRYTAADDGSTPVYGPCSECGVAFFAHPKPTSVPSQPRRVEHEKFRQHSMLLNQIGYTVAVALGKVKSPDDYHGDVVADFGELLELHEKVCKSDRAAAYRRRDDAHEIDRLTDLVRDLIADDDSYYYPGGPCRHCTAYAEDPEPHRPDCAWLRAKAIVDKVDQ